MAAVSAYYNEIDPYAADWLRNLIRAGHIAPGDVDERDIRDVRPADLRAYRQCHFFAGIGVWSYALRRAGWPDDRPVWTGSCPCQPFSAAGRGAGFADERHLWPHWHYLIRQHRPDVVFGEQVASKDGLGWLDLVQADMEADLYALGAVPFPAAGIGAPHGRHRIYFVADGKGQRASRQNCGAGRLVDAGRDRNWQHSRELSRDESQHEIRTANGDYAPVSTSAARGVVYPGEQRLSHAQLEELLGSGRRGEGRATRQPSHSFWSDPDWLWCRDSKFRPVEPGSFPLAHGAPARVGRLRAYGNAIVAPAAQAFIESYLEQEMLS